MVDDVVDDALGELGADLPVQNARREEADQRAGRDVGGDHDGRLLDRVLLLVADGLAGQRVADADASGLEGGDLLLDEVDRRLADRRWRRAQRVRGRRERLLPGLVVREERLDLARRLGQPRDGLVGCALEATGQA